MKRVNLQHISNKVTGSVFSWQNAYGVWLDYGVTVYFSNKKHASRFKAFVNENLTGFAFELNSVYSDLFLEYRRIYFNITVKSEKKLLWRLVCDIENGFERIIDYSEKHGYAISTIRDFDKLCWNLEALAIYLVEWYKAKNRYSEARKVANLAGRAASVLDGIKELPNSFNAL